MQHKQLALRLLKVAIIAVVVWGIVRAVDHARTELRTQQFDWQGLDVRCFLIAGSVYFVAQLPMGWFWQRTLRAFGQPISFYAAFRAFFIGHLGKYVPGKFLVVVLRSGLVAGADPVLAGVAVFVETLTGMACGAFLAAMMLCFWFPDQRGLQALAVGLMLATMLGTLPPVMRRFVQAMQQRRGQPLPDDQLAAINVRLMLQGWLAATLMWGLTTCAFWWVLKGLPGTEPLSFQLATLARLTASVCLAVVAGFVSLIPGGLGIREWVLNQLLIPEFGPAIALIAAVTLRLVMLLTEVAGSIILYGVPPRARPD